MKSSMEQMLDDLIANAALLKECEEEKGECADLEHKQEYLLNTLLKMNQKLEPRHYSTLEKKIEKLSRMNYKLLRPVAKKARIHKKKTKSKQLSLDL